MKKILLPTDFSSNAWNAITYALEFYKDEWCMFYLLNTYTPVIYRVDYLIGGPAYSAIPDVGIDISLAGLERTLEHIKKEYSNEKHQFQTLSAFNTLTDEVAELCEKEGIDMIIMGTKGASRVKEVFMGSNAVHVIRKAKVPVLAIPEGYEYLRINTILLPSDYTVTYHAEDIQPLIQIIKKEGATLHIIHSVEERPNELQLMNKEHLKQLTKSLSVVFEDIINEYMPNIVHSYVDKHNIGLVAMMNKKHTFLERLLIRQNIDAVGYQCTVPFMVLPDNT